MRRRGVDLRIDTLPVLNNRCRVAGSLAIASETIIRFSCKCCIADRPRLPGVIEAAGAVKAEAVDDAGLRALVREGC